MLRISKLRLRNFKSFRKADIPFCRGFSAIVGANGSGKTNIIDALLFVFGITSLKTLRAARLTDLVNHDASENYAKVEAELTDGKRTYVISRTIDRQGRSIVRLDGKKRGLNEVSAMLNELGVNPTGHNIVAQGDVTRIIEMNAKQRRGVIEEIAGLTEFEEKKAEAIDKLDKVDRKIKDVMLILSERESYLQELEKEREDALQYGRLTAELKVSKATILGMRIARAKKEAEARMRKAGERENEVEANRRQSEALAEEEQKLEARLGEITDKLIESGQKTYSTLGREVEESRAAVRIAEDRAAAAKEMLSRAQEKRSALKEKAKALRSALKEKEEAAQRSEFVASQLIADIAPMEERERRGAEAAKEREAGLKSAEAELGRRRQELSQAEARGLKLNVAVAALEKELSIVAARMEELGSGSCRELKEKAKGIEAAKAEALKLVQLAEKCRKETAELAKETKAAAACARIEANLAKLSESLVRLKDGLSGALEAIRAFSGESELKRHAQRSKELEHALAGKKTEIGETDSGIAKLRDGIKAVEAALSRERSALMGFAQHEALNQMRSRLAEARNTLTAHKVQVEELRARIEEAEKEAHEAAQDAGKVEAGIEGEVGKIAKLRKALESKEAELDKANKATAVLEEEKQRISTKVVNSGEKRDSLERSTERLNAELNELKLEIAREEVRAADLEQEFAAYKDVKLLEGAKLHELESRVPEIEREISKLGAINMRAIEGVDQYRKEMLDVKEKAQKLEEERQAVLEMIDKIDVKKLNVFMHCFNEINSRFMRIYYSFFGGEGRLGLTNAENPIEGGLTIEAKYKEGVLKSIDAMSGGEKSLTALAFMFAIQSYEPAPFYIFDEADAALDMANSVMVARLMKDISGSSQLIAITHNNAITKEADQLIGVALNKQRSSVIGLRLRGRIEGEEEQLSAELKGENGERQEEGAGE